MPAARHRIHQLREKSRTGSTKLSHAGHVLRSVIPAALDESFILHHDDTIASVRQAHREARESSRLATSSLGWTTGSTAPGAARSRCAVPPCTARTRLPEAIHESLLDIYAHPAEVASQVASRRSAYLRSSIGMWASAASIASSAAQSTWGATPRPSQLVPVTESVQYPNGSSLVTVAASRISVT